MKVLESLNVGWFDLVAVCLIVVGLIRGRKRGMSVELLDVFQWLLIVFICGRTYKPLGEFLTQLANMSMFFSYVWSYLAVLLGIKLVFGFFKRVAGGKIVGSDLFGRMEYYLGMIAGMVRYSCMLVVAMALLNAKLVTDEEYQQQAKMQQENFGSISFPTIGSLQREVFRKSLTGQIVTQHLSEQLIQATAYVDVIQRNEGFGKRKERELEDVIGGSKKK